MMLPTGSESLCAPHCRSRAWLLASKFSILSAGQVSKDCAMASRSVGPMCSSLVAAMLSKPQLNAAQEGIGNNLAERKVKKAKLHCSRWELVALYFFWQGETQNSSSRERITSVVPVIPHRFSAVPPFFCEMH